MTMNIIAVLFTSILIDFLEFTIILPLLPKILTYYGSASGLNQVKTIDRFRIRCILKPCHWCNSSVI